MLQTSLSIDQIFSEAGTLHKMVSNIMKAKTDRQIF